MGGVGKTMITAAVVRDERIREGFTVIGWINLSQQPDIMSLQLRLYEQLSKNESMPAKQQSSTEQQLEALRKVAIGQTALVILDDIWDSNHESVPFLFLFRRPGFILSIIRRLLATMRKQQADCW